MLTLAFGELYWKRNKWDRPTAAVEGEVIGVLYRLEMIERKKSETSSSRALFYRIYKCGVIKSHVTGWDYGKP